MNWTRRIMVDRDASPSAVEKGGLRRAVKGVLDHHQETSR